jgi:hypothetical protein
MTFIRMTLSRVVMYAFVKIVTLSKVKNDTILPSFILLSVILLDVIVLFCSVYF